jgi:HSP20 family protein
MVRPTPWRRDFAGPIQALQSELGKLLEEYWNPARVGATPTEPVDLEPAQWSPAIDLYETPNEIIVLADLPGVDPATIDLSVTGNVLSLRGTRPTDGPAETQGQSALRERPSGSFHRQVVLSNEVNFDAVQADARNGVLRVRLPKQEAAKPRTIPVQSA